jgi:translation initiation factor IF-1
MPEVPIQTIGVIREAIPDRVFRVELPNGKLVVGHLPRRLSDLAIRLTPGDRVELEMTPYDFEKARIVGLADHPHE